MAVNMELEALNDDQFIQDFWYPSGFYINQNSEQDLQVATGKDPTIGQQQLDQRQYTDISSDKDSYSKQNIPEIADRLARKRAYDKAYRERLKENQKRMKSSLETTEAENGLLKRENESLKYENGLVNHKYQAQSKELDGLRNNFEELKQRIKNQHENERQIECTLRTFEAEITSLKEENAAVNMKCEIQSKELGKLKKKYEKQQEKKKGMKSNMKAVVAENEFLKQRLETKSKELDEYKNNLDKLNRPKFMKQLKMKSHLEAEIESLKEKYASVNQSFEAKTKELDELNRNNFYKFNQEFIKKRSQAGSIINFMEWFGQYPNLETEGFTQSCRVTGPLSSKAFPTSANSPGMGLPSPQPGNTFESTPNEFIIN